MVISIGFSKVSTKKKVRQNLVDNYLSLYLKICYLHLPINNKKKCIPLFIY